MKFIRWQGIAILTALIGLIALMALFLLPFATKKSIEFFGTQAVGAKVEVNHVDYDYWPLAIRIKGLRITDPDQPMQNLVEFDIAHFNIPLTQWILDQIIIDNIEITGIQLNTARKQSGAINTASEPDHKTPSSTPESDNSNRWMNTAQSGLNQLADLSPDIDDILARQPLQTDQAYRELKQHYEDKKAEWKTLKASLPNKDTLKDYEKRINVITNTSINSPNDLITLKNQLNTLKKTIQKDKKTIQQAKAQLVEDHKLLKQETMALKAAPQADFNVLKNKYSFNESGALNVSQLLLGQRTRNIIESVNSYYKKLWPIWQRFQSENDEQAPAERAKGRFIHFPTDKPRVAFWIKQGHFDLMTDIGHFNITARDITHQPAQINRPAVIDIKGVNLKQMDQFVAQLSIDGRQKPLHSSLTFTINKYQLAHQALAKSKDFTMTLDNSDLSSQGTMQLTGKALDGQLAIQLTDMHFTTEANNNIAKQLGQSLNTMNNMNASIDIAGSAQSPSIKITSDVDDKMKRLLADQFKQQKQKFEKRLKAALNKKASNMLKDSDQLSTLFNQEQIELNQLDDQLSGLLSQNIDNISTKQQKNIEDKLKKQLQKWF